MDTFSCHSHFYIHFFLKNYITTFREVQMSKYCILVHYLKTETGQISPSMLGGLGFFFFSPLDIWDLTSLSQHASANMVTYYRLWKS